MRVYATCTRCGTTVRLGTGYGNKFHGKCPNCGNMVVAYKKISYKR